MKLSAKLALIATAITVVALLASTILMISFTKMNVQETIISAGINDFTTFYADFSDIEYSSHINELDVFLRYRFYHTSGFDEYSLEDGNKMVSNATGINIRAILENAGYTEQAIVKFENPIRYAISRFEGQDYFFASTDINIMEHDCHLSFARDITQAMEGIRHLATKCAVSGGLAIIISAATTWFLTRRSLKPILALEKGASEVAAGNYERRIAINGHDEIANLAGSFNDMAEAISLKVNELSETAEHQKIFINGLSHELKTPVTSIMARSETLLAREISDADRQHSLERIYDQAAWLERLASKLMTLTMLEGSIEMRLASVPELFASVEATVADALKESEVNLRIHCETDILKIDVDLMRSALVNLIENARRASLRGAYIELAAENHIITVKDSGKGIPAEELSRVTEPFYMVDHSRSKKNGGSGIGLALVKRIVKAHNARLEIMSELGIGTSVSIIFSDVDKMITF